MKTKLLIIAAALAATASMAQTNQVLSRNAVGYTKIDLPPNELRFATMQFNNLDGSPLAVSNVLASVSNGTQAILWDIGNQNYITLLKNKGSWGAGGTNLISRSSAFFIKGPAAASQAVFLMGEVPDATTATQTVSQLTPGFNMSASAYPVSVAWSNTQIAAALPNGDQFIVWDPSITNYQTFSKGKGSWGAGGAYVIKPGEGFFIRKVSTTTNVWAEVKPYTWP